MAAKAEGGHPPACQRGSVQWQASHASRRGAQLGGSAVQRRHISAGAEHMGPQRGGGEGKGPAGQGVSERRPRPVILWGNGRRTRRRRRGWIPAAAAARRTPSGCGGRERPRAAGGGAHLLPTVPDPQRKYNRPQPRSSEESRPRETLDGLGIAEWPALGLERRRGVVRPQVRLPAVTKEATGQAGR